MRSAVLALAAATALGAAGCGCSEPVGTADSGTELAVKSTRWQVSGSKTAPTVQGKYETRAAKGEFLIVTVKVTLGGKQGRPFRRDSAKVVAGDGTSHELDVEASQTGDPRSHLVGEQLERDRPRTGVLVFDVPKGSASGARLRVEDLRSRAHGFISLSP